MICEVFHLYDKHTDKVGNPVYVNLMHLSMMQDTSSKVPFLILFFTNGIRMEVIHQKGSAHAISRWQEFLRG